MVIRYVRKHLVQSRARFGKIGMGLSVSPFPGVMTISLGWDSRNSIDDSSQVGSLVWGSISGRSIIPTIPQPIGRLLVLPIILLFLAVTVSAVFLVPPVCTIFDELSQVPLLNQTFNFFFKVTTIFSFMTNISVISTIKARIYFSLFSGYFRRWPSKVLLLYHSQYL